MAKGKREDRRNPRQRARKKINKALERNRRAKTEEEQQAFLKKAEDLEKEREKQDQNAIKEGADVLQNKWKRRYQDDQNRFEDKFLLNAFAMEAMKTLYPNEKHKDLDKEGMEAEAERLVEEDDPKDIVITDQDKTLKSILHDVMIYNTFSKVANDEHTTQMGGLSSKEKRCHFESRLVSRIYRNLDALYDDMLKKHNEQKTRELTEEEAEAEDRKELVTASMLNFFEQQMSGKLGLDPTKPIDPAAVHIAETSLFLENEDDRDYAMNPEKKDNEVLEEIRRNMPLFPHTPSSFDVVQGRTGDCYYVSVLAAIADKNPERIREMMKDNGNGTVTVRFFQKVDDHMEPFYVTVDKVVSRTQARGSIWVSTMERALAVSGMMVSNRYDRKADMRPVPAGINDVLKHAEDRAAFSRDPENKKKYPWLFAKNPDRASFWKPDLDQIRGGKESDVFEMLLGDDAIVENMDMRGLAQKKPDSDEDVLPIPFDAAYTDQEKDVFNKIKEALEKKEMVTCGTYPSEQGDSKKIIGLNLRHAYTIRGVEKVNIDGNERLFIRIRNPHGKIGRTYVKDKENRTIRAVVSSELEKTNHEYKDGTCYVELKHFCNEFEICSVAHLKENSQERSVRISREEERTLRAYHTALQQITQRLKDNEGHFGYNSPEYDSLKAYLDNLNQDFPRTYAALNESMDGLKERISAYKAHTKAEVRTDKRRKGKLYACEVAEEIIDICKSGFRRPDHVLMERAVEQGINNLRSSVMETEKKEGHKKLLLARIDKKPVETKQQILRFSELHGGDRKAQNIMKLYEKSKQGLEMYDMIDAVNTAAAYQRKGEKMKTIKDVREHFSKRDKRAFEQKKQEFENGGKKIEDEKKQPVKTTMEEIRFSL